MDTNQILSQANEAYHSGEGRINEALLPGERGDGLADFIATELRDVCQGVDASQLAEVSLQAIHRARDELRQVAFALEQMASSTPIFPTGDQREQ